MLYSTACRVNSGGRIDFTSWSPKVHVCAVLGAVVEFVPSHKPDLQAGLSAAESARRVQQLAAELVAPTVSQPAAGARITCEEQRDGRVALSCGGRTVTDACEGKLQVTH